MYWFCHISKWIRHRYTCVPHPEPSSLLLPHTIPLPVVFKHGCLLELHLELWRKKSISRHLYFFRKFQDNSNVHLEFKKWLQVFLLNGNFSDIKFYYFLLTNHDTIIKTNTSWIITIVKDIYMFLQLITRQKIEDNYSCKPWWKHG